MKIRIVIAIVAIGFIPSLQAGIGNNALACFLKLGGKSVPLTPAQVLKAKTDEFRGKIVHKEPHGVDRLAMEAQKKAIRILDTITRSKRGAVSHLKTYTDILLLQQIANNFSLVPKKARYEELLALREQNEALSATPDSTRIIIPLDIHNLNNPIKPKRIDASDERGQSLREAFMDVVAGTRENIKDFQAVPEKIRSLFRQHSQSLLDLSTLQAELDNPARAKDDPKFERIVTMPRWDFESESPTTQGAHEENYSRNEIERQLRSLKNNDIPSLEKELGELIHKHARWLQTLELRRDALRDFGRSLRAKAEHTNEHDVPELADTLIEEINTVLAAPTVNIAGVQFDPSKASPASGRAYRSKVIGDHISKISGGLLQFKSKAITKLSAINSRVEALKKLDPLMAVQIQKSLSAQLLQVASSGVGTVLRTVGATGILGISALGLAPKSSTEQDPLELIEKECIDLARANSPDFEACVAKYTRELVKKSSSTQETSSALSSVETEKLRKEIATNSKADLNRAILNFRLAKIQGTEAAKLAKQIMKDMSEVEGDFKQLEQQIESIDKTTTLPKVKGP